LRSAAAADIKPEFFCAKPVSAHGFRNNHI
jgi:hypothetical protein